MSLGEDVRATLPYLREQAESMMTETIDAGTETETPDPVTYETITAVDAIYSGPAQVKYPSLTASPRVAGSQQYTSAELTVKVPIAAVFLPEGTIIKPTASTVDPSLVGRRYRVTAAPISGNVTCHRYPVEELT